MDIRLALMCGTDIPIPELQTAIHQPTIKEISLIGEEDFFIGVQTLVINKNMLKVEVKSVLEGTTNFQIFMTIMQEKEMREKKKAVLQLFQLIFPGNQVLITPRAIIMNQNDISIIIDDSNFDILQEYIKQIFCLNSGFGDQTSFNPGDEQARKIAEKLMRGRQRVAAQKGENTGSALGRYLSILTIGTNTMPLSETINLTMYQLYDLVERYTLYLNWDLDIRSRLAGAKSDSKPEDWMKNIH